MKIFITGVAGFLGSHLAEHLRDQGHQIWGCDNLSGGDPHNVPGGVAWSTTDCRNQALMRAELDIFKPELLYHCAAMAHEGLSSFSPAFICDNIFQASVATFSAAIAAGVKRIVFTSSMARYGKGSWLASAGSCTIHARVPRDPPFYEEMEPAPVDPYGISKVAAEQVLKVLCETHGVKYRIAVPHNIIGPRQNFTDPYRNVASIFLNRLRQGKQGIVYGDGTQKRCFSPAADILPCLAALGLDDSLENGGVWNIGPDNGEISINELYKTCCDVAGVTCDPAYVPGRPNEVRDAWCTADKARKELGYLERATLGDTLAAMYAAIPIGGKPFRYEGAPLEIVTDKTPATWKERLI